MYMCMIQSVCPWILLCHPVAAAVSIRVPVAMSHCHSIRLDQIPSFTSTSHLRLSVEPKKVFFFQSLGSFLPVCRCIFFLMCLAQDALTLGHFSLVNHAPSPSSNASSTFSWATATSWPIQIYVAIGAEAYLSPAVGDCSETGLP